MRCCAAIIDGSVELTFCRIAPLPSGLCPKGNPRLIVDAQDEHSNESSAEFWARLEAACHIPQANPRAADTVICFPVELGTTG